MVYKINLGEINLSSAAATSATSGGDIKRHAQSLTTTVFSIVEAVAQHPQLLLHNQTVLVDQVLPVLATFFVQSGDGNLRMLSLKLFADISTFYLDSEDDLSLLKSNLLQVCLL